MTDSANTPDTAQRPAPAKPIVPKSASEALRPQAGTPPPRRSRQSRSQFVVFLNFLMSIVVLVVLGAGLAAYLGKQAFEGPGPLTSTDTVYIKPNSGLGTISDLLERNGFISNARIFGLGVRAYGNDTKLKPGEYAVKAGASMHDIMELLVSGRAVTYSLTIPEGLTVAQAWRRIAENEVLSGEMPTDMPSEGSLVADTQRIERGMTRKEVVEKMVADQKALVEDIWERRQSDLPIENVDEFLILASIVEKETGHPEERPRVASVFLNRLEKGMRLQSDPTIIYGLFGGDGKPSGRPIYRSDIDKVTPYNTYQIDGLPPTPIANPGRAALEAVANPSRTEDLYFVADGNGGHAFAQTLEQHNQNVARWRQIEAKRKAEGQAAPEGEIEIVDDKAQN